MRYYKKLNITLTDGKMFFGKNEIDNYIDIINDFASYGWKLNQILALPSHEKNTLLNLEIILETENEQLFQGFSY